MEAEASGDDISLCPLVTLDDHGGSSVPVVRLVSGSFREGPRLVSVGADGNIAVRDLPPDQDSISVAGKLTGKLDAPGCLDLCTGGVCRAAGGKQMAAVAAREGGVLILNVDGSVPSLVSRCGFPVAFCCVRLLAAHISSAGSLLQLQRSKYA